MRPDIKRGDFWSIVDGGEMGHRIRHFDWSTTVLGSITDWPQSLKTAICIVLGSRQPMLVGWGPERIVIYNDACIPILGDRHPGGLGRPGGQVWRELWMEPPGSEGGNRILHPHGETSYTVAQSWIPDDEGEIGGVFCLWTEEPRRLTDRQPPDWLREVGSPASPAGTSRPLSGSSRPVILLVDDHPDTREYLGRLLRERYEVLAAANGEAALAMLRERPPDLVLADVMMPRLNGFELIKAVRADPQTHTLPVILVSALTGEDARIKGLEAGADDYIIKPFGERELLARVGGTLELARVRREAVQREAELQAQVVDIIESITDAFLALDRDWRITYVNAAAERLNDISRESLLGRDHWEVFPAVRETLVEWELRRAMTDRVVVRFENFYPPYDRWFEVDAYPMGDGGLAIYGRDITERKRADEALRESEERLRLATTAAGLFAWDIDLTTGTVKYSETAARTVGEESLPAECYDLQAALRLIHDDDRERVTAITRQAIRETGSFTAVYRVRSPGSEYIWIESHGIVIRNSEDQPVRLLGVAGNVTLRKRGEAALREAQDRLRMAMDAARIYSWEMNVITEQIEWSPNHREVLGFPLFDDFRKTVGLLHPDDREPTIEAVSRAIELGEPYEGEFRLVHPETGEFVWGRWQGVLVRETTDGQPRFVGVTQNITERKRAEEELLALQNRLAADLSAMTRLHELNNRLLATSELQPLLQEVLDAVIELQGSDFGSVRLYNRQTGSLEIVAQRGFDREFLAYFGRVAADGEGASSRALRRRERVVIEDIEADPDYAPLRAIAASAGYRAVQSTLLFDRNGEPLGMLSTHFRQPHRPTERELRLTDLYAGQAAEIIGFKLAEKEMLREQAHLLDLAYDAIIARDSADRIVFWNRGAERLYGWTAEEALGRNSHELWQTIFPQPLAEIRAIVRRDRHWEGELIHSRRDGSRLVVASRWALSEAGAQGEERVLQVNLDITRRKEIEEEGQRLLRRIVQTQEEERRRLSRELHDHFGQQLTALRLGIENFQWQTETPSCDRLAELRDQIQRLDLEVDFLAWELRPATLDEFGLASTISIFIAQWSKQFGITVEFHTVGLDHERLGSEAEINLYRITQEALNNISKHAQAGRVGVVLERRAGQAILMAEDDGIGFDPQQGGRSGAAEKGLGLVGMRERATLIGGILEIESSPGGGTTILVRVPVPPCGNRPGS